MKLRYIFGAVLLALLSVACNKEGLVGKFDDLSVENSFLPISTDGGSAVLKITSADSWTFAKYIDSGKKDSDNQPIMVELPSWLTANTLSGSAGTTDVTLEAASTSGGREAELKIVSGDKSLFVRVRQGSLEATNATVKEIYEGPDGKTFRVKGTCTGIYNTTYGNWYLDDGTNGENVLTIYGTLDKDGKTKNFESLGIEVGDVVTVEGPKSTYGTTIELVDVTVLKIEKALVKIVKAPTAEVSKEGGDVSVIVAYKGSGVYPTVSNNAKDWLVYKSTEFKVGVPTIFEKSPADTAIVTFSVSANDAAAREGVVNFTSSSSAKNSTTVPVTISQESGYTAFPLPYEESFLGSTGGWEMVDVVPVAGVSSIWVNDAKYGMKATATKKVVAQGEIISPNIDLKSVSSAVLSFEHVSRYANSVWEELKLFVSTDNGVNWEELLIPVYSSGKDWNFVSSTDISLKKFVGNLIRIKFQYNSTADAYATWEIKNLKVEQGSATIATIAGLVDDTVDAETAWNGNFTDAVVSYVNGNNAFIEDATGGIQLYLKDHGLVAGSKISGKVSGKVKIYNGFAELTALDCSAATVTAGEVPEPKEITLASLLKAYLRWQNCKVLLKEVTFTTALTESNRNGEISQGDAKIAAYSQVNGKVSMAGTGNLICLPTRYKTTLQVGCWESGHFTPAN